MSDPILLRGILVGLLVGAGVFGHALRLVTLQGQPDAAGRRGVAVAAIVIYGVASALLLGSDSKAGLWVATVGPLLGLSSVLVLKAFGRSSGVDHFQIVLGVPQAVAIALASHLLRTLP